MPTNIIFGKKKLIWNNWRSP